MNLKDITEVIAAYVTADHRVHVGHERGPPPYEAFAELCAKVPVILDYVKEEIGRLKPSAGRPLADADYESGIRCAALERLAASIERKQA